MRTCGGGSNPLIGSSPPKALHHWHPHLLAAAQLQLRIHAAMDRSPFGSYTCRRFGRRDMEVEPMAACWPDSSSSHSKTSAPTATTANVTDATGKDPVGTSRFPARVLTPPLSSFLKPARYVV